jgi:hypothetical protein
VGTVRTEHDLLESIVYPSASFVGSFEPMIVRTETGDDYNGVVRKDSPDEVILATGPETEVHISRSDIIEMHQGTVSIMPQGLDTQLTMQEWPIWLPSLKIPGGERSKTAFSATAKRSRINFQPLFSSLSALNGDRGALRCTFWASLKISSRVAPGRIHRQSLTGTGLPASSMATYTTSAWVTRAVSCGAKARVASTVTRTVIDVWPIFMVSV